jgi:hypothetical protein
MAPKHRGAAGAEHGSWATAGDSIPAALREPCAEVNSLVRSVVGSAPQARESRRSSGHERLRSITSSRKRRRPVVNSSVPTHCRPLLFKAMENAFQDAKWMSMEATYSADGPDGSDIGYSRDELLCVIEGRWDGGDDSDTAVIPGPDFDVFVTCAPPRADDKPS